MSLSSVQYLEGRVSSSWARISVWRSGRRRKRFLDPLVVVVVVEQAAANEGRFPALGSRLARNRSMGSPWRQTSPYLYSPRCFPMKLRVAPSPLSRKPHTQLSLIRPSVRSFVPPWPPKVVGLSQVAFTLRRSPKEPARIFVRRDARKRRLTAPASSSFCVFRLSACFLYAPQYFARSLFLSLREILFATKKLVRS